MCSVRAERGSGRFGATTDSANQTSRHGGEFDGSNQCRTVQRAQTNRVDWIGVAVVLASLAIVTAGVIAVTKIGIHMDGRPHKPSGIHRAKSEYEPPEPPEGRYWG